LAPSIDGPWSIDGVGIDGPLAHCRRGRNAPARAVCAGGVRRSPVSAGYLVSFSHFFQHAAPVAHWLFVVLVALLLRVAGVTEGAFADGASDPVGDFASAVHALYRVVDFLCVKNMGGGFPPPIRLQFFRLLMMSFAVRESIILGTRMSTLHPSLLTNP